MKIINEITDRRDALRTRNTHRVLPTFYTIRYKIECIKQKHVTCSYKETVSVRDTDIRHPPCDIKLPWLISKNI